MIKSPYKAVFEYIAYDLSEFPFSKVIANYLEVADISKLHEVVASRQLRAVESQDNYTEREKLKQLEDDSEFYKLLQLLMSRVLKPLFEGPMSYTQHPTFRVHMPRTQSISAWHRDTQVTGRHDQITAWIPFVDTRDTNTIWVEQTYGGEDYLPIPVEYGEVLLLDTSYLSHGSVANETNTTRVSIDLRMSGSYGSNEPIIKRILGTRPPDYYVEGEHTWGLAPIIAKREIGSESLI